MPTQTQPDPKLVALAAAYQAQSVDIRARIENHVRRFWKSLGVYRDAEQARYVHEVVPVVLGAQRQMSSVTSVFIAEQRRAALGGRLAIIPVDQQKVTGAAARLGTPPAEVYARPFHLVWRQLDELPHEPGSIEQAILSGENRAVELALDDVQLAKFHTNAEAGKRDDRVMYVERILEGPSSCGLCIVASTQRYHPGQLAPLHGGCDCSIAWKYADGDPGQILHLDRLQDIHDRIEERFGQSSPSARQIPGTASNYDKALEYRDVLVTHAHGELGEVLGVRGRHFTGPDQLS